MVVQLFSRQCWKALAVMILAAGSAVSAEEIVYNMGLVLVLNNDYSPDCQNLQLERRSLFLAQLTDDAGTNNITAPSMPGPLIEATEGDTLVIRITNYHPTMGVSLHFHGIHQVGTPWADGPAYITQCPLGPYQTQEYRFEAYPPGTHLWHAHVLMNVVDGMTGPIIIHPKTAPDLAYDEEQILFLQDFYSQTGEDQLAGLLNYPFTWIGNPDSLLINGKGLAGKCLPPDGTSLGDPSVCLDNCNDTLAWIPTIDVESNSTYRFRIISAAQLVMQNIAIVGHNMTIVEVEGTLVDPPITVSNYDVAPGQRVSVLVTMDQEPGNYLIETTVRERDIPGLTARAILHYVDDLTDVTLPNESPEHPAWNNSADAETLQDSLHTKSPSGYPEAVALEASEEEIQRWVIVGTQNHRLDEITGEIVQLRWAVNNISGIFISEPLIGRAVRMARENGWPTDLGGDTVDVPKTPPVVWNYTDFVDSVPGPNLGQEGVAVIRLSQGDVFEIVLQNARALDGTPDFHTWHSHGHSFWVVGRGEGIFDAETDPANYNLVDPLLRDTATLWPLGWTALRMVANNPGVWYFHCHLNSHLVMGMAFSLVVEPGMIGDPSESVAYCQSQDLSPANQESGTKGEHTAFSMGKTYSWVSLLGAAAALWLLG